MSRIYDIFLQCGAKVSTDSRRVASGELFFALKGDNFDGNDYAQKALEGGAGWVIADRAELRGVDSRIEVVDDSLLALQELAREHRRALGLQIIGLTGTNGKTTTKELLRAALSTRFDEVGATKGNLNNHIGVPLTLLSFTSSTEVGVVEMGANHPGEIKELCAIAEPNIGLITNVGRAHLEGFGSPEGVVKTKGELYDFLEESGGVAIYNSDDALLCDMVSSREGLKVHGYSANSGVQTTLKLFGNYNYRNAAGAMAVARFLGGDEAKIRAALAEYTPANNRSEVIPKTSLGNLLVVDCYNANPSSMEVAQNEFLNFATTQPKVMILGSMKELGEYSLVEHQRVVERALKADKVIFIGEEFRGVAPDEMLYSSKEEFSDCLRAAPLCNSTILLKGSRSNSLEYLISLL